jgi:hypothetical protein
MRDRRTRRLTLGEYGALTPDQAPLCARQSSAKRSQARKLLILLAPETD